VSIPVSLPDLADTLGRYPWGYFVTVGPDLRAHSLAVPTQFRDGSLHFAGGRSSRANASAMPEVTMVFPPQQPGEYSLILDGAAVVVGDDISFTPSHAILHRPAVT
jgi:hypothetical protein